MTLDEHWYIALPAFPPHSLAVPGLHKLQAQQSGGGGGEVRGTHKCIQQAVCSFQCPAACESCGFRWEGESKAGQEGDVDTGK